MARPGSCITGAAAREPEPCMAAMGSTRWVRLRASAVSRCPTAKHTNRSTGCGYCVMSFAVTAAAWASSAAAPAWITRLRSIDRRNSHSVEAACPGRLAWVSTAAARAPWERSLYLTKADAGGSRRRTVCGALGLPDFGWHRREAAARAIPWIVIRRAWLATSGTAWSAGAPRESAMVSCSPAAGRPPTSPPPLARDTNSPVVRVMVTARPPPE